MENKQKMRLSRLRRKHKLLKVYVSIEAMELAVLFDLRQAKKDKNKELIKYLKQQLKGVK